ncbi:MAG: hypothetical protein OXE77_12005 [Flavobacteriaceae bacterium]|nr:hypothetical protein [Flavobacteriaceae bacterium]MCY4268438.1 hypothetical protein [Flavobacteriaceae bacterium]
MHILCWCGCAFVAIGQQKEIPLAQYLADGRTQFPAQATDCGCGGMIPTTFQDEKVQYVHQALAIDYEPDDHERTTYEIILSRAYIPRSSAKRWRWKKTKRFLDDLKTQGLSTEDFQYRLGIHFDDILRNHRVRIQKFLEKLPLDMYYQIPNS